MFSRHKDYKKRNAERMHFFLPDPDDLMKTQLNFCWDREFIVIICMIDKAT